jgi:hypothetical protein
MKRIEMSKEQKRYSLKLLFDNTQISKEELEQKAKDVLQNFLPNIHLSVDAMYSTSLQLTLEGELEIIDTCHDKVNKVLITPSQLKTKRLLDEVGDEIRQQAYPILAAIEQRFRVFVSQALTEVSGFDWWYTTAPADLRSKVQPIQEKHQEDGTPLDPLECTQFDDLIKIITAETSEWSESRILSVSDFRELLSNCASVAEVRDKLIEKTKKVAFWDVFARYFQDKKEWDKIKRLINFVINERHKVMHHRPIRLGVIKALLAKKEEIFALLDMAKPELSEKERIEAKQDIQDVWERRTILQEYIQPSLDWQKLVEQAAQPPDWQKLMEQAAQPPDWQKLMEQAAQPPDWQKLMEQAAQPPKDWQKLMEQATQPPVDLAKMNDKPEFKQEKNLDSDIDNSPDDSQHRIKTSHID